MTYSRNEKFRNKKFQILELPKYKRIIQFRKLVFTFTDSCPSGLRLLNWTFAIRNFQKTLTDQSNFFIELDSKILEHSPPRFDIFSKNFKFFDLLKIRKMELKHPMAKHSSMFYIIPSLFLYFFQVCLWPDSSGRIWWYPIEKFKFLSKIEF